MAVQGGGGASDVLAAAYERVKWLAGSNAVVIFSMTGCCMCHVVKSLLFGLGVGPTIVELDQCEFGPEMRSVLHRLAGGRHHQAVPVVFVGGKFLGGIESVMACHINGTLIPLLKEAGALWL
uniref:Glutaredoxin domain-containing protein n=1 Tax=Kalanchoe fedtschenkoi TaxID=63787 RepID=A0A7N0SW48_KALFE